MKPPILDLVFSDPNDPFCVGTSKDVDCANDSQDSIGKVALSPTIAYSCNQDTTNYEHDVSVMSRSDSENGKVCSAWSRYIASIWLVVGLIVSAILLFQAVGRQVFFAGDDKKARSCNYLTKNIEDVAVGERVLAEDPQTGKKSLKKVVAKYVRRVDHLRILEIEGSNGSSQIIKTTNEHPFWVNGVGWVKAIKLKRGQKIRQVDGNVAIIRSTVYMPHPNGIDVYNFQVEGFHTYFVASHGSRAPPLLVHNNDDCFEFVQLGINRVAAFGRSGQVHGSGSSTQLARNMLRRMGLRRRTARGYQAHHLIPVETMDHDILIKTGFKIDDASNGIFLPSSRSRSMGKRGNTHIVRQSILPVHTSEHPAYNAAIKAYLDKLDPNASVEQLRRQVSELQEHIARLLEQGSPLRTQDIVNIERRQRILGNTAGSREALADATQFWTNLLGEP